MNLVLFIGAPGIGKSTRMDYLTDYKKISVTQILIDSGLDSSRGNLVSDEVVIDIISNKLQSMSDNIILDGFPRNINQFKYLLEKNITIQRIYYINTPDDVIIKRALNKFYLINNY